MISGKILKSHGWPEGKIIGLAKAAAESLQRTGLEQDAILVWLEGVRVEPGRYLSDPHVRRAGARVPAPRQARSLRRGRGAARAAAATIPSGATTRSTARRGRRWRTRCACRSRWRAR